MSTTLNGWSKLPAGRGAYSTLSPTPASTTAPPARRRSPRNPTLPSTTMSGRTPAACSRRSGKPTAPRPGCPNRRPDGCRRPRGNARLRLLRGVESCRRGTLADSRPTSIRRSAQSTPDRSRRTSPVTAGATQCQSPKWFSGRSAMQTRQRWTAVSLTGATIGRRPGNRPRWVWR